MFVVPIAQRRVVSRIVVSTPAFSVRYVARSRSARRGLTLIEILVALIASLIILAAVVRVLGFVTEGVADSRSIIESTNRLRFAQHLLRTDLAGATSQGMLWQAGDMGTGYFEVVEGPLVDSAYQVDTTTDTSSKSLKGDPDDVLFFTIRSLGQPFVGKAGNVTLESDKAEVVWFCTRTLDQSGNPKSYADGTAIYTLRRRIFLIVNDTAVSSPPSNNTLPNQMYDVSVRMKPSGGGAALNTLGTLGNRKNRVFHNSGDNSCFNVPSSISNTNVNLSERAALTFDGGARNGEDIVLQNVLSFDVKVFDPTAPIRQNTSIAGLGLIPGDVGYDGATDSQSRGAFVDLGKGNFSDFTQLMGFAKTASNTYQNRPAGSVTVAGPPTYDTWTFDYENDGVSQKTSGAADPAVNGQDDQVNGSYDGVVDDANERETFPPYPYPLRGVQVKIRVYDPVSKSVRESTIEETFVP